MGDNEIDDKFDDEIEKKGWNLSKSKKIKSGFLTFGARMTFTKLSQRFIKALILHHFDPEYYIRVETNVLDYAIDKVLNQLTSDDLGRWHPVVFFLQKKILAEIKYKTHDNELLAIVEAFKIWRYYLKGF